MPELPEVETVRRGLEKLVLGRRIEEVRINVPKMVKTDLATFMAKLPGQVIQAMRRRGKYLIFDFGQDVMISHLRMEGKYLLFPQEVPENKHFHAFFELDDGSTLVYQDVRKFGTFEFLPQSQLEDYFVAKKIGPEPVAEAFDLVSFQAKLANSKKPIKNLLLDQTVVAGLGNIYVDEALFEAKVHPERLANSLDTSETKRLRQAIIDILSLAVAKGGSTIRTYRNALGEDGTMQDFLKVYGKTGEPCPQCGTEIIKLKVGGRGTHICPNCQRKNG